MATALRVVEKQQELRTFEWARNEWVRNCNQNGLSRRTVDWYLERSGVFLKWAMTRGIREPDEVTHNDMAAFLDEQRAAGSSEATIRGLYNVVKILLGWCVGQGLIKTNPLSGMHRPRITKNRIPLATAADIDQLLRVAQQTGKKEGTKGFLGLRDEVAIALGAMCGLRLGEVVGLRVGDVDAVRSSLRVRNGKGNKERTVYFNDDVRRLFQRYSRKRDTYAAKFNRTNNGPEGPFLITANGREWTRSGLATSFRRLRSQANVRVKFHALRHAYAAGYLGAGGGEFALQEQLGHESLDMVRHYAKLFAKNRKDEAQRYTPFTGMIRRS